MAQSAINSRTEIRQSDSNRLGRVSVRAGASRSIVGGIVGGSGTDTRLDSSWNASLYESVETGLCPVRAGGAPPPPETSIFNLRSSILDLQSSIFNFQTLILNLRQRHGRHGRPLLLDKFRGFSTPKWSRKISALVHTHAVSSARAAPDRATRAANLSESRIRFPDSPATRRSRQLPEGSTCSK